MNVRTGRSWWAVPALLLLLSAVLSARISAAVATRPRATGETEAAGLLVMLSRRPAAALGFRNALADVVWLKAVQVAGDRRMAPADFDRLYVLLDAVANYDDRFFVPYVLGGLILGVSPAHGDQALKILERGRRKFPDDWRFPFYIGYTRYFVLGDPLGGGRSIALAAALRGSPTHLPGLASRMLSEGRSPETALSILQAMLRQEEDAARREILAERIRAVIVERDLQRLELAVRAFRDAKGVPPESLRDLVEGGFLREIPREPNGGQYLLGPGGEVASDRVAGRLRVLRP